VWALLPFREGPEAAALEAAGVTVDRIMTPGEVAGWRGMLPSLPATLVAGLEVGKAGAWRRYWLGACISSLFVTSPHPDGPHPPRAAWADPALLEELRRSVRLHRRLRYWFSRGPGLHPDGGLRLAADWDGRGPPGEGWASFVPWGFPPEPPVLVQRRGSIVPLLSTSLEDPSSPGELELRVVLGGPDFLAMPDGSEFRLGSESLQVQGGERDYVIVVNGRHHRRVRSGDLSLDLSGAALDQQPDLSVLEEAGLAEQNQFRHGYDLDPRAPGPRDAVRVRATAPTSSSYRRVLLHYAAGGSAETTTVELSPADGEGGLRFEGEIPPLPSAEMVRYRIEAKSDRTSEFAEDAGPHYVYPDLEVPYARPPLDRFSYLPGPHEVPEWARDAVIYHLLVDRFAAPDGRSLLPEEEVPWLGFAGGTIRGLIERLDYVADLGADVVWISPIFRAQMHVGYDVEDFFDVHPRLGTLKDVRDLCSAAHSMGIRLILDFEPSYLGSRHPFALSASQSADSPYRDWFHWHRWPGRPYGWLGSQMLVALDHGHHPVRAHLLEAARFWLDLGLDGFRLDSAHAAPLDFWSDFALAVRRHSPDAFTVGEVMAPLEGCLPYQGRLNGFLDFELSNGLRGFLGKGDVSPDELDEIVVRRDGLFGLFLGASFLENHDMDRFTFISRDYGNARLRSALLLMMGLPDTPILYYGTEVGATQRSAGDIDLTVRPPMLWHGSRDEDLRSYVKELIRWRRAHPALRRGTYKRLATSGVYSFERRLSQDLVVVAVNPSGGEVTLTLGPDLWQPETRQELQSFGPARVRRERGSVEVNLGPFEGCFLSASETRG
jgi:cyclomaltodextrinase